MQVFPFSFTADSSGDPDAITLPANLPAGAKQITVKPPAGHSWTIFERPGGTGFPKQLDEAHVFQRDQTQAAYAAGEVIGFAALDSGSGTFNGIAQ